jgi:hypothetical protein
VVTERSWGLLAAIITYSHSFSGYGSEHPPTQVAGVQPLAHYNFNKCYYLRSSGIWNIDHGNRVSLIPIGFGAGKVTLLRSGIVMNLYVEPQRWVHHTGSGSPTMADPHCRHVSVSQSGQTEQEHTLNASETSGGWFWQQR